MWTSAAHKADWGVCLASTDPSAPKHKGITYFLVDMRSPGIVIRPLREITGDELFNEVFFDDVFVPDEMVVGAVNDGWRLARTTLASERVAMAHGTALGNPMEQMLRTAWPRPNWTRRWPIGSAIYCWPLRSVRCSITGSPNWPSAAGTPVRRPAPAS